MCNDDLGILYPIHWINYVFRWLLDYFEKKEDEYILHFSYDRIASYTVYGSVFIL